MRFVKTQNSPIFAPPDFQAELAQTWADIYKRPKLGPATLVGLLKKLNHHIIPDIGVMRVRDVKPGARPKKTTLLPALLQIIARIDL